MNPGHPTLQVLTPESTVESDANAVSTSSLPIFSGACSVNIVHNHYCGNTGNRARLPSLQICDSYATCKISLGEASDNPRVSVFWQIEI